MNEQMSFAATLTLANWLALVMQFISLLTAVGGSRGRCRCVTMAEFPPPGNFHLATMHENFANPNELKELLLLCYST